MTQDPPGMIAKEGQRKSGEAVIGRQHSPSESVCKMLGKGTFNCQKNPLEILKSLV